MTKLYNIKNNDMLYFLLFSVVLIRSSSSPTSVTRSRK